MHVYAARWVLPIATAPVPHGAVAADAAGRIAYVGPRAGAPAGAVTDLGDAALLPGLVDAHARLAPAAVRLGLAAGVTTFAGIAGPADALDAVDALCAFDARGIVHRALAGSDAAEREGALAALRQDVAARRARATDAGAERRVSVGVAPRAASAVHEDLLLDACAWAVGEQLPVAMPAGESAHEIAFLREAAGPVADALRARGLPVVRRAHSTVHLLAELGIAAVARPLLLHATHFDESDVALAAHYDCPVAVCPGDAAPGAGRAPLRALLDAGVRLGLGTTSASGDTLSSVFESVRLVLRPTAGTDADVLSPHEALQLATLGGARALGLDHTIGSLEAGKQADLCAFAVGATVADPVDAIVYARPVPHPLLTVVQGHVLAREGCVLRAGPAAGDA